MKQKMKSNKGITLIALVITIIVLLILAAVTIATLTGENGILTKAQKAKEKTELADKNERANLDKIPELIDEQVSGDKAVEQVTDENPGKLEEDGTEPNTYTINSIEDLVVFAYEVTNGNTYADKTVKLGKSLDFASTKSYVDAYRTDYGDYGYNGELKQTLNESGFIPIGTQEINEETSIKCFHGTFNGDGNTIYNLKIREERSDSSTFGGTGMFTKNYGTIQALGVEKANIYVNFGIGNDMWHAVGILASSLPESGKIDKCHVSGRIVSTVGDCDVGGIVGATSSGGVYNSYSEVDIEVLGNGR